MPSYTTYVFPDIEVFAYSSEYISRDEAVSGAFGAVNKTFFGSRT